MLVKITPEQVTDFWNLLEPAIEGALPPIVGEQPEKMKKILESLLLGIMDCWVSFSQDAQNGILIDGVVTTKIVSDEVSGTRDLLIYSVYGVRQIMKDRWEEGYKVLRKWAKVNNCTRITAYTQLASIKKMCEKFGGDASQSYLILPVE